MHQTFYIDPDEEISSVVDRLSKSTSVDNYFVLPKRAIFLQSIVNLKLLKREADKIGKRAIVVTQDEVGASMAERSGIETRPTLDGLEPIVDTELDEQEQEEEDEIYVAPVKAVKVEQKKQTRLNGVGSSNFYDAATPSNKKSSAKSVAVKSESRKIPVNSISSAADQEHHLSQKSAQPVLRSQAQAKAPIARKSQMAPIFCRSGKLDLQKEKALEKMYSLPENNPRKQNQPLPKTERKIKKIFIGFIGLCLLAFVGVAAYLFWPSAKVTIEPNIIKSKLDLDLHGSSDVLEIDQANIPIRVIDKEESISLSYEVKGGATVAGKKAHGSVVLYNEFDASPQTLIATTRLESTDGKIFRLVKNVVVPGTTTVGGEIKPGAITAEIIADQPGTDYNIDPTTFTIPGFKDGPKYKKFYAKSTEPILGGSTEGETAGGAVSQNDIDNAKQETEAELKSKIVQLIGDELLGGEIALEQAEKVIITKSSASIKRGDMVAKFEYTATASARALVFSENDVKKNMEQSLKKEQQTGEAKVDLIKVDYGTVNADFDKNTLDLKAYGEVMVVPIIDTQQVKKDLLGKKDDQLEAVLRKYLTIKSVKVEFQPTFVSRIPQYAQRVSVEIKNNTD
jgi:hypothetical protein